MPTALQMVVRAYQALGVVTGVTTATNPTNDQRNDGLTALNSMLDSWSNESLACYQIGEGSHTLSIGTSQYSIGSGGTINATRPLKIVQAYIQDTAGNNYPLNIRERQWWNYIGNRSSSITSQIPTDLFYDPQFPLGYINIFPTPLAAYTLYYDQVTQISNLSTLTASLSMPPGYERAMIYNLAVEISNSFGIPMMGQTNVAELASQSMANIKRTNIRENISAYDGGLLQRRNPTYNIFRDE